MGDSAAGGGSSTGDRQAISKWLIRFRAAAGTDFKDIFILRISHFSKDPLSPSGNPQLAPSLAEQANPPSSATVVAGSSIKLAVICDHWGYAKSVVDSAVHVHGSMSKQLLTRSLEVFP